MKILTLYQAQTIERLAISRLSQYIRESRVSTIVLGISGGLDSAVMAVIGLKTIENLKKDGYKCGFIYDFIDVESNPTDLVKARTLAKQFAFMLGEYNYTDWFQKSPIRDTQHVNQKNIRVANGNLKCRIRMLHLYDRAQLFGGIVLDTDDLSELLMGFWTRHGDVGDVKVIQHLTKEEVRDLGEYFGITPLILESAPGDGLGVTDTNQAQDQLKMTYLKIDYIMSRLVNRGFDFNGSFIQMEEPSFLWYVEFISQEIGEPIENILHVVRQSLRTAYKRKHGDDVANLLSDRTEMKLPDLGTHYFNEIYLEAILASN